MQPNFSRELALNALLKTLWQRKLKVSVIVRQPQLTHSNDDWQRVRQSHRFNA